MRTETPSAVVSPNTGVTASETIRAVFDSDVGSGFRTRFPAVVGSSPCQLDVSGPMSTSSRLIPATCRTEIRRNETDLVVVFTQGWEAAQFHANDDPSTGQLEHSWFFSVHKTGSPEVGSAVSFIAQSGSFPPQYMK